MLVVAFLLLASGFSHAASEHVPDMRRTSFEGLPGSMRRHHHPKPRVPWDNNNPWTFLGCYSYGGSNPVFQDISYNTTVESVDSCRSVCLSRGLKFAGLENGQQCQCSDYIIKEAIPVSLHSENNCDAPGAVDGNNNNSSVLSVYGQTSILFPTLWPRLGCFTNTGNPSALVGFSKGSGFNSPLACSALCALMNYTFSGVGNGDECFCGNSVAWTGGSGQPAPDSECSVCSIPCSLGIGTCRGNNRIEIYTSPKYSSSSPWNLTENYVSFGGQLMLMDN